MDARWESLAANRLRVLARVLFFWSLVVFLRLLDLQVFEHDTYRHLAEQQQQRQVELQAPRGAIFDRNGLALALSVPVDSVCINPLRISDPALAADLLSRILRVDRQELLGRIVTAAENRRGFMWVKRKITPEESRRVRSLNVDWIEFRQESRRFYPKGQTLAHVLGGVDHEEKGNAGIELALNKDLQGKPGVMRTTADVRQKVFDAHVFTDPEPGRNLTLTIDERIQYVAERELAAAVKEHKANTGSLVVMDPKTGDILAMANYPTFDPNKPPRPGESLQPRTNLAISAPFEPGSVFKVITLAAALETTRLTPGHTFHCGNGAMTLFRRVIHDAKPHGTLSMADILAKSSNIGAIKIALEVGNSNMYEWVRKFGFGSRTGVPLPGESGGVVRKLHKWIPSSIGSVAMGHEMSATSLQLARACAVVANGGYLVKPRLVIKRGRPSETDQIEKPADPQRIMRPEKAIALRRMMQGVVLHGTGRTGATLDGYSSAGKTGSAQIYDYAARVYTHRYNGSFMGFAPVSDPRVVVVVTLNGTQSGSRGFGGVVAAPVFRKVATAALRILDVPKDLPDGTMLDREGDAVPMPDLAIASLTGTPPAPEEDQVEWADPLKPEPATVPFGPALPPPAGVVLAAAPQGPKVPDFRGKSMRAVFEQSAALGVQVEYLGTGVARLQDPQPGAVLRRGERVKVQFAR